MKLPAIDIASQMYIIKFLDWYNNFKTKKMIHDVIKGDIFESKNNHIIFAVTTEGSNHFGFSGDVISKCWPELENTGGNELGEVLTKKVGDKTFHAIVCHGLHKNVGWTQAPAIIEKAINEMSFPETECASIIAIGTSYFATISSAPLPEIMQALKNCNKQLAVYSLPIKKRR